MWPLKRKIRRRLDSRRGRDAAEHLRRGGAVMMLLAAGFFLAAAAMDVWPVEPMPYHEGQYVAHDIYARAPFSLRSDEKMRDERNRIEQATPAVFRLDSRGVNDFLAELGSVPDSFKAASQPSQLPRALQDRWAVAPGSAAAWAALREGPRRQQYQTQVQELGKELVATPFVASAPYEAQMSRGAHDVVLVQDSSQRRTVSKMQLVDIANTARVAQLAARFESPIREGVLKQLQALLAHPNYPYDELATVQAVTNAKAQLEKDPTSLVFDAHAQGELIVPYGGYLTAAQLRLLEAEQEQFLAAQVQSNPLWQVWCLLGRAGTVLLMCLLLWAFVLRYEADVALSRWHGFTVAATLLAAMGINRLLMPTLYSEPVAMLTMVMAVMILTIAYDQRLALMLGLMLALLMVHQLHGALSEFIVLLVGASAAVLQLREVRSRSKLIEAGAVTAAVVFVSVCAVAAAGGLPWAVTLKYAVLGALAALFAGFLVQGLLPLVERFFRVATSLTLLEWCDASRPLLKRLAVEAPGTFNHSLHLGAICEAAAEAIGARGLLARAGAYYHDIGKIDKPEYFVENQGGLNPHARLSPAMSLLIIIGHVKDGLELAVEYGLPVVLRQFIATHHGTTLVQYFYYAATEQRKADSDRAPDEVEFRYPGPKPRSREAAILMLADASESSVRAMPEPTPGRIENQVHTMVTRRLMDGQLDECDLTLREVRQIEASLVRSLCGVYHSRIPYPRLPAQKGGESRRDAGRNGRSNGHGPDANPDAALKPAAPESEARP